MTTPAWPAGLPQTWSLDTIYQRQSQIIESEVDAGPPKTRRRHSAVVAHVDTRVRFTGAQVATFESFWDNDIAGGAGKFTRTHPVTDVTATFQFRTKEGDPRWTPVVSDTTPGVREWEATFALRILP